MPSQRPRMALTLPQATIEALEDLGDAIGKPASTIAAEMLTEMAPQLHDMAKMTRFAKQGKKAAAKRVLHHMIGDAAAEMVTASQPPLFADKPARKRAR